MHNEHVIDEKPGLIYFMCLFYGLHMVEEFLFGFVEWADRYFGSFDWTQNIIGNTMFFAFMVAACRLYRKDPDKHLWAGMSLAMWILTNFCIHGAATVLGGEYSPGVVTATAVYLPAGVYFLARWGRRGVLTWRNMLLSFAVGGLAFMLVPSLIRAVYLHAQFARIFGLVR
jgi:hypothetical protein